MGAVLTSSLHIVSHAAVGLSHCSDRAGCLGSFIFTIFGALHSLSTEEAAEINSFCVIFSFDSETELYPETLF